jgi:hypothetical protein
LQRGVGDRYDLAKVKPNTDDYGGREICLIFIFEKEIIK